MYISTCRNEGCPLVILVDVRLGARCQQCVGASIVDLQLVKHGVTMCQKWQHQCSPWCVWIVCTGIAWNLGRFANTDLMCSIIWLKVILDARDVVTL